MKIKHGFILITLLSFVKIAYCQPIINSEDIIKLVKLSIIERIDVVKQELKSHEYVIVKENKPYELDNANHKIDIRLKYKKNYYNFKKNDYNFEPMIEYSVEYIEKNTENEMKILFNTHCSNEFINYSFTGLKSYIISNYEIKTTYNKKGNFACYGIYNGNNEKYHITDCRLFILPDFLHKGYSSLTFYLELLKKTK